MWVEAVERGGWTDADLEEMPFTLLIKKVAVSLIEHTRAVTKTALRDRRGPERGHTPARSSVDRDILLSGAILHDVGKLFEYKREGGASSSRAGKASSCAIPISGAAFAFKYGLPQEVVHIIAAHTKEGDGGRRTIEAIIVNHADFVNFDVFKE